VVHRVTDSFKRLIYKINFVTYFIIDFASKIIMKGTKVTVIHLLQKRKVKLR